MKTNNLFSVFLFTLLIAIFLIVLLQQPVSISESATTGRLVAESESVVSVEDSSSGSTSSVGSSSSGSSGSSGTKSSTSGTGSSGSSTGTSTHSQGTSVSPVGKQSTNSVKASSSAQESTVSGQQAGTKSSTSGTGSSGSSGSFASSETEDTSRFSLTRTGSVSVASVVMASKIASDYGLSNAEVSGSNDKNSNTVYGKRYAKLFGFPVEIPTEVEFSDDGTEISAKQPMWARILNGFGLIR